MWREIDRFRSLDRFFAIVKPRFLAVGYFEVLALGAICGVLDHVVTWPEPIEFWLKMGCLFLAGLSGTVFAFGPMCSQKLAELVLCDGASWKEGQHGFYLVGVMGAGCVIVAIAEAIQRV